ncbi:MAG: DegV family protein [Pigeon pea little leaf phytoplasma]|uniref:DegV family protein n=1 Tax=Candidatus Phytoplasma fabacearum TaxID=2982628 RepID=A0ABU8ZT57_9MOLU|nr:DegV family protein ['Bituminaria bituminosa' little leaf phytoplasma]MDV3148856.1 DegV family protein [Pigeon pea little leaf phytoplasma]MDO7983738.1 DegV family protein ['Bituminaria bituminosa' little leaf phytoplasma]MDO8024110.1 DegV family protein ['Bituminaria bituminosa' little leaf phytoplasma]MDO8030807.1 DegV family protein ['Bituminaria bituminosa' little leaf phytoplasma]MDV3154259.1 DegV family protein [Pigeon pea little leaf phytoplasma]
MNIKVISTSTSCLDYFHQKHNIGLIRLQIFLNNQEYRDGENLTADQFYDFITKNPRLIATTSQPPIGEIVEYFRQIARLGYQKIFVTTLSSALSGSYNSILSASKIVASEIEVIVFDTQSVGFCEAYCALQAERMFSEGFGISEVIAYLEKLRQNNKIFFIVDSLNHLIKSGRLSMAKGFLGRIFHIKPILKLEAPGVITMIKKVFTMEKAFDCILKEIHNYTKNQKFLLHVLTSGNPLMKNKLIEILKKNLNISNILEVIITPVIGAHVGNNALGVGLIIPPA